MKKIPIGMQLIRIFASIGFVITIAEVTSFFVNKEFSTLSTLMNITFFTLITVGLVYAINTIVAISNRNKKALYISCISLSLLMVFSIASFAINAQTTTAVRIGIELLLLVYMLKNTDYFTHS